MLTEDFTFDFSRLKQYLADKRISVAKLAEISGISLPCLYAKLKGYRTFSNGKEGHRFPAYFTSREMAILADALDIPFCMIPYYFLQLNIKEGDSID